MKEYFLTKYFSLNPSIENKINHQQAISADRRIEKRTENKNKANYISGFRKDIRCS